MTAVEPSMLSAIRIEQSADDKEVNEALRSSLFLKNLNTNNFRALAFSNSKQKKERTDADKKGIYENIVFLNALRTSMLSTIPSSNFSEQRKEIIENTNAARDRQYVVTEKELSSLIGKKTLLSKLFTSLDDSRLKATGYVCLASSVPAGGVSLFASVERIGAQYRIRVENRESSTNQAIAQAALVSFANTVETVRKEYLSS